MMGFYDNGRSSKLLDFLRSCEGYPVISTGTLPADAESFPWFQWSNVDECQQKYQTLANHLYDVIEEPFTDYRHAAIEFFEVADTYATRDEETITQDEVRQSEYPECYAAVEEGKRLKEDFDEEFKRLYDLKEGLNGDQQKKDEVLNNAEWLQGHFNQFQMPLSVYEELEERLEATCSNNTDFTDVLDDRTSRLIENLEKSQDSVRRSEPLLRRWAEHVHAIGKHESYPIDNIMTHYLNGSITKQELAQEFLSPKGVAQREEFFKNYTEMKQLIQV